MVEQRTLNPFVEGSIPSRPTRILLVKQTLKPTSRLAFLFFRYKICPSVQIRYSARTHIPIENQWQPSLKRLPEPGRRSFAGQVFPQPSRRSASKKMRKTGRAGQKTRWCAVCSFNEDHPNAYCRITTFDCFRLRSPSPSFSIHAVLMANSGLYLQITSCKSNIQPSGC